MGPACLAAAGVAGRGHGGEEEASAGVAPGHGLALPPGGEQLPSRVEQSHLSHRQSWQNTLISHPTAGLQILVSHPKLSIMR